jgi:hypothetical protein
VKSANYRVSKSSRASEFASYDKVAGEYYDEDIHPTCADFRSASQIYLKQFFQQIKPSGRTADVGCGKSQVANFQNRDLVLIDKSEEMLRWSEPNFDMRLRDVERESIGVLEFDWIFSVLGDPYNSLATWKNLHAALKVDGQCVFIVPSYDWAYKFRLASKDEKQDFARFLTSKGEVVFLRSLIVEPEEQVRMIADAGLSLVSVDHVLVGDLPHIRSPKISAMLSRDECILDIYRACRTG